MPTIPVITPVRLARITLAGLVIAGMASSGLVFAAGWTGPSSPAPLNNTPELIWNAQETGFTPQNASFNITGSGVLGQFAAGGYSIDAGGIAVTTPSLWSDDIAMRNGIVLDELLIDPGTGSLTLGGVRRTAWPEETGGDITGITAGPNLTGGGDTGDISLDLSSDPSVNTLTVGTSAVIPSITFNGSGAGRLFWSGTFSRLEFASQPFFSQGLNTGAGTVSTFSGPVNVTGASGTLTAQAGVRASTICALGGSACNGAPYNLAETVSGATFCIGADCRTSWPAGGGGGAGTVTSITSGTGITATPNPLTGAGTIALNTTYTDTVYVNASGDTAMTGTYFANPGTLQMVSNAAGAVITGTNNGSGQGVSGSTVTSIGVIGDSSGSGTGVYGNSSSGIGVRGLSGSSYGVLGQGSTGARFLNGPGGIVTNLSTATDGFNSTGRVVAPEYCIGASCITAWPAGGAGAYVLKAGDIMSGALTINSQLNVDSGAIGPAIRGTSNGERGIIGTSNAAGSGDGSTGVQGVANGGSGVYGSSQSSYGVRGQTVSGAAAGYFVRGGTAVSLATAADGVNTSGNITVTGTGRVTSPTYCIGASCISAWPAGGSTSISAGPGITVSPSPITGAGTITLDTGTTDSRYVNNTGPDQVIGEFAVNSTSGFQSLDVGNTGSGNAIDASNNAAAATIVAYNGYNLGAAGYFHNNNGSAVDTYIAYGGTYGVYTYGRVRAASIEIGGVVKTTLPQYTKVTQGAVTIAAGWNNAPAACPAGYKVTGINCFQWNYPAAGQYVGCVSQPVAGNDSAVQLFGQGTRQVSYTLYCVSGL